MSVSFKLYVIANCKSLQISVSGMPVVEASLTLVLLSIPVLVVQVGVYRPVFVSHSISVFRLDLLHRRKCTLTHVCVSKHRVHF